MSNDYRGESRRRPPLERYGTPGTQYPTANPYDIVITEEAVNRENVFEPILFGTPHPTVAAALLCYQSPVKSNNQDKAPIRIYANPRLAQEPYNLVTLDDEANNNSYPVYVRSYLLPRGYTKATKALALTALIGLTLVSGGTGYAASNTSPGYGKIALSFSGGAGSGAAGFAECAGGIIVAVCLTNTGTGYTSAPTVSVSGGSGASITALIQPTTALLVDEVEQPAEDPYGGYFVRVTRRWETYAGQVLTGKIMSSEAQGAVVTTTKQVLPTADADYSPDWKTLSYSDTPIDANRKERNVVTMPDSVFPILTDYDQDPEMQSLITTTFQVVQASAVSAPSVVAGVITRYKHIDKWRSLKIVETYATPASYSEQKFSGQNFPNLFSTFYHDEDCGTIIFQRGAFSAMVEIRLDISFGSYALVSGLTLIPNTFSFGSFRVSDILNDASTLTSTGACAYSLPLPASSPDVSTYVAYGATKQLVSGEVILWRAGIFRTTKLFVRML